MNINNQHTILAKKLNMVILAIIVCTLWGSAPPLLKLSFDLFQITQQDFFSRILFGGYRFLLAGIFIVLFVKFFNTRNNKLTKQVFKHAFLLGLIMTFCQSLCFYTGLMFVKAMTSSVLMSSSIFINVGLALIFLKDEHFNYLQFTGLLIGLWGIIIFGNTSFSFITEFSLKGEGLLILGQLCNSIGMIYFKKIKNEVSIPLVTGVQTTFGALLLIILGLSFGGNVNILISNKATLIFTYLVILSALSFSIWTSLIKYNNIHDISVFLFLIPVIGSVTSYFIFGEAFTINKIISLVLISFAILIVNKPLTRKPMMSKI
ncbi:MAG: DMT family transporter [Bacteroidetes bacterium]|nr:DMT family transporter [Bacteroidota bacterium]